MNRLYLAILLHLCFWSLQASSQQAIITEEKSGTWRHFQKIEFKLDSTPAWYIKPTKALPGNPWVWRAHFPNWHTEMDSILLEKGFYVAYINTNNLYGHASAMMVWDKFYDYLVNSKGFAQKVALEGVSRGGLYIYNWAKRNPGKVSCIYAEAPVCDFKSWPGGKGRGKGSESDWKKLLLVYGLTEEEALRFADQPKDNLDALAAFKVPILHVVGLNDSIVPNDENTFTLVNNYIKKGGPATVISMTKGRHELGGHHFPIENPGKLADFIYSNSLPVADPLKSEEFIHPYGSLNNVLYRIAKEKKATVAFLGGSITHMEGWRDKVCRYLQELCPQTAFTFINAGIPSLGSLPHAFRLQKDVLDKGRIDLMFIESAVNDQVNGTPEMQQYRALEGIIRHAYQANPYMNTIMMAFADENKIADYQSGKIPLEVKVHDAVARHYNLPFVNLAEEVSRRIKNREFNWEDDFKNLHPSPFGQEIYFAAIKTLLQQQLRDKTPGVLSKSKLPVPLQKAAYTAGRYLDINNARIKKGFTINPSWKPADQVRTRPGFVQVPMLVAENPKASLELQFEGTCIGITVVSGPDAGKLEYTIDGKSPQTVDLYTKWSKSLHLPWYVILADDLEKGRHTLKLTVADERGEQSKGTACRIVYFLVN